MSIIVERGAKIVAQGTASDPVVFTTNQPVGGRDARDWGGIVILGEAPTSKGANQPLLGLKDNSFTYGGNTPNDNSGELNYVRIEYTGQIGENTTTALPGLTLAGVGKGTKLNHVQVSFTESDGIRFLGGTVDAKYIITYACKEDDLDMDEGYKGRLQFVLANKNPFVSTVTSFSDGLEARSNVEAFIANYTYLGGMALIRNLRRQNTDLVVSENTGGNRVVTPRHGMGIYLTDATTNVNVYNSLVIGANLAGIGLGATNNYQPGQIANKLVGNAILGSRQSSISVDNLFAGGFGIIKEFLSTGPVFFDHFAEGSAKDILNEFTGELFPFNNEIAIGATEGGEPDLNELQGNVFNVWGVQTMADFSLLTINPNFLPTLDRLRNSTTNGPLPSDGFFEPVLFKGAFGTIDWTKGGWSTFDPQLIDY